MKHEKLITKINICCVVICYISIWVCLYHFKHLYEAVWGEGYTWTASMCSTHGLKDTKMYKHEFDSLMMMYAIDNLTELQKRIAP